MEANPHYYRGTPAIRRVVIKRIPQSANRYVLMRMGVAHLAEKLTPRELQALRGQPGIRVAGLIGNESLFLHMNFKSAPFDNPLLRKAIAYAVPYDQIIRTGYLGQAVSWHGVVPSNYPYFAAARTPYRYDPAKARELLAAAGYPDGHGLERYESSFHLTYVVEKEATLGPIATVLRTALRRVGIPVELDPIPLTQYGDRQLIKKDLQLALNDQEKPAIVDAGYAIVLFFVTPRNGGVNNMVQYANPQVDELWLKARVEADTARRASLLAEAQQHLLDDVAWLPIVEYRTQWAMDTRLAGLTWYPDNAVRFADLHWQAASAAR
jgi:peptide/nickel transport system substrate-binding protein